MSDTDEIIRVTQEIERIDRELLSLEKPLPRPIDINAPGPYFVRGWMGCAENVTKEEAQAERKELWAKYEAEKEERSKWSQQLSEERAVLNKYREKLLSASVGQPINGAEPMVWQGEKWQWVDMVLGLRKRGLIDAESDTDALKRAAAHWVSQDRKPFNVRSALQAYKAKKNAS